MSVGTLYLIPVPLGGSDIASALPPRVAETACRLQHFVVENEKTARRILGALRTIKPVREIDLRILDENTRDEALVDLLSPLLAGHDLGMMSEAGCPAVADPGARLVMLAHHYGVRVAPLVGPSSILLALMASGLNGQRFSFLSYLPREKKERQRRLREIEAESSQCGKTQIFIETPYRNQHLLEDILLVCSDKTKLCVARSISLERELIVSRYIADWKKTPLPDLYKQPTVFLLSA